MYKCKLHLLNFKHENTTKGWRPFHHSPPDPNQVAPLGLCSSLGTDMSPMIHSGTKRGKGGLVYMFTCSWLTLTSLKSCNARMVNDSQCLVCSRGGRWAAGELEASVLAIMSWKKQTHYHHMQVSFINTHIQDSTWCPQQLKFQDTADFYQCHNHKYEDNMLPH